MTIDGKKRYGSNLLKTVLANGARRPSKAQLINQLIATVVLPLVCFCGLLAIESNSGPEAGRHLEVGQYVSVPETGPCLGPVRGSLNGPFQEVAFVELVSCRRHRLLKKVKRCRSRAEIENERRELLERYQREIDGIAAEYHDRLPKKMAKLIGAIYARFSTRFQDSVPDQVRALFELAIREGIFIPRENIFFDTAVRGCRSRRPGLSALRTAIEARQFDVLLVLSTNRLFRKLYKAMQFVEEEIVERGLHCICKNWIDTRDKDQWRLKLQFAGTLDEATTSMYGENIRAAHQNLLAKRMVVTTLPFGYDGEPIPGQFTKRGRPQRLIVIDEEAAPYVKRMFDWFISRVVPIDEIARRLNDDPDAPPPPKSPTGRWTHDSVRTVLTCACYRGDWSYGANETKWLSKKDYPIKVAREQPLAEFFFEELRIIADDLWYSVQQLVAEQAGKGRTPSNGDRQSRPRLLNGLFYCPEHDRPLNVGGAHGKTMFCQACRYVGREKRPLYSKLNRVLALRNTCAKLAELIRSDANLVQDAVSACQLCAEELKRPDPTTLEKLKAREGKLTQQIKFNMRNPGMSDEEQSESASVLRDLRAERTQVQGEIAAYEALIKQQIEVPSEKQVRDELDHLANVLLEAAAGVCHDSLGEVREIIRLVTGGRIDLYQQGERKAQRGWLQGRFTLRLLDVVVEKLVGVNCSLGDTAIEVSIDYRKPRPSADQAERAYELDQQRVLRAEIANVLGVSPSRLTKLLHDAYSARGEEMPDGRVRRANLPKKNQRPPNYQQIADRAVALMQSKGFADGKIGKKLGGYSAFVVGQAIRWWHESHGLPVPTSQERRLARAMLAKALIDSGREMQSAAEELECSTNTLRRLLDIAYLSQGQTRPDGRSRRHEEGGATGS